MESCGPSATVYHIHVPFETHVLPLSLLCSLSGSIKFWWKAPSDLDLILHPRAAVAGVQPSCKRCCYVLATAAAAGENTPMGKRAQLTSILRMMSNLGPSTRSSDLCWGPLGHDGGVCTCAFTCMGRKWPSCWSGQASQGVIIKLKRKRNAIYCGPKLMQQDLCFHPNMQNANRKRNSRCYKNTCHEQAFVPDALQILPPIFTVTLKPEHYYL